MNKTDITLGRAIGPVTMEHARSTTKRTWLHTLGCAALATAILLQPLSSPADTETVDGIEWKYTVKDGEASIGAMSIFERRYCAIPTSTKGAITIPSRLGGYPVTYIGISAFSDCRSLASVTIPVGVTGIDQWAFSRCSGLTSVTIPAGMKGIGPGAFGGCSGLTSVTIPNSVWSIGIQAFSGCSGLTSVTIPAGVKSIEECAFIGCSGLTAISVNSDNPVYDSRNGCNAIIRTKSGELIAGCKNTVIPDSVKSIGNGAFYECCGLTAVTIPDSVTSIGEWAFRGCSGLTSITIPDSVTSIGEWAFRGCSGLTSVTIPAGMKGIGHGVFEGCSGLTSVTIPDSVTSIGDMAFSCCSGLTSVTIPAGVTNIVRSAFRGCSGLTAISVDSNNPVYDSRNGCNAIIETASGKLIAGYKNTVIPDSVKSIGEWAFSDCSGLAVVTVPDSVTSIGADAFSGCSGLTSITIPDSVTSIGREAFSGCSKLETVFLSKGYSGNTDVFPKGVKIVRGNENMSVGDRDPATKDKRRGDDEDGGITPSEQSRLTPSEQYAISMGLAKGQTDEFSIESRLAKWRSDLLGTAKEVAKLASEMVPIPGKNYAICKYEVTQALWEAVMGENPSKFKGANRPVENVSWNDCQKFLEKLNALPEVKTSGRVYRLPTADEWEYACRADSKGDFCRLADGTDVTHATLGKVSWHLENSGDETHPVGQKEPNAFGLYDMHGNVLEWTSSATDIGCRIECGGCWDFSAFYGCKSGDRFADPPDHYANDVGFRLASDSDTGDGATTANEKE